MWLRDRSTLRVIFEKQEVKIIFMAMKMHLTVTKTTLNHHLNTESILKLQDTQKSLLIMAIIYIRIQITLHL